MILCNRDGVEWLEFEILAQFKEVAHAIFLRNGGESEVPYDSLNFSYFVGDDPAAVAKNEEKAKEIVGVQRFVRGKIGHGNRIAFFEGEVEGLGKEYDGLLTDCAGVGLLMTHADCQICFLYDPIKRVVVNVHCGWRGNVLNIYREAVLGMKARYGCRPSDLIACVSPSLGPKHAEFIHYDKEFPSSFLKYKVSDCHFDLWAAAQDQLLDLGVLPHHIEIAKICTYEDEEHYYSYRRGKVSGRHGAVIALR